MGVRATSQSIKVSIKNTSGGKSVKILIPIK
mgnify:CR=1 FL=1